MKKFALYNLIFLVLFVFNYKTINFCFQQLSEQNKSYYQNLDMEDSDSESDESDDTNEKKELSEFVSFEKGFEWKNEYRSSFPSNIQFLYTHSGYSPGVYSPPELNTI